MIQLPNKLALKVPTSGVSEGTAVEVGRAFHRWIQDDAVPELAIDVASYLHVSGGPGVILVCHESYYSLDFQDGFPGLRWSSRGREDADAEVILVRAIERLRQAATRLSQLFVVDWRQAELSVLDRTVEPAEELRTAFESALGTILGRAIPLRRVSRDARALLTYAGDFSP